MQSLNGLALSRSIRAREDEDDRHLRLAELPLGLEEPGAELRELALVVLLRNPPSQLRRFEHLTTPRERRPLSLRSPRLDLFHVDVDVTTLVVTRP
jgi:hypothetical protein